MEHKKPTYTTALRMAQLVALLARSWRPVPLEEITGILGISARTAQRYRKALNDGLSASSEKQFLEVMRTDGIEKWSLAGQSEQTAPTAFRVISLAVAKAILKSLEGTVITENVAAVQQTLLQGLQPSKRRELEDADKKFRYSGFGRKNYAGQDIALTKILRGLLHQRMLKVRYYAQWKEKEKEHILAPYTLLLHDDALYLIGAIKGKKQVTTFAVERLRDVALTGETFRVPADYCPDAVIDGSFGIYQKPGSQERFTVKIEFSETLHDYITTRLWHPTQRFSAVKKGSFTMQASLTNTREFIPWVLQYGSDAKVLEPAWLREEVCKELNKALGRYAAESA